MGILKEKVSELQTSQSIITQDCIVSGNITTKGSIKIEGSLEGNINEAKEVFISKTGMINGDISCSNCIIYGIVKGNITAKDIIEIMSSASVEGDLTTSRIMIEEGAKFNGKINTNSKK